MSRRRTQLIVIAVLAALIVVAAIVISQTGSEKESDSPSGGADASQVEDVFADVIQSGTFLGDPNAPVVVTEFADLQCPFCAEFATEALPAVIDEHVRSGEVALDLRLIAFLGEDSVEAAEVAAAAALQNRLWQFADVFYLNQGEENSGFVTEDFLREIAESTPGLDAELALRQRSSAASAALMDENEALARRLGVEGTPSFYLADRGGQPEPLELSELTAEAFGQALESARGG